MNKDIHDNGQNKNRNKEIIAGAGALISVLAVPVTILAGILLGNKRGKN